MNIQTSRSTSQASYPTGHVKEKKQAILLGILAVGYVLSQIIPIPQIETWLSILIIFIIIFILPTMRGVSLFTSVILLISGMLLLGMNQAPLPEWLAGFQTNLVLVSLFIFSPLLGIPIKNGGYVQALQITLARKMNHPYFFFLGSKILTHVIGTVLNLGAAPIVYHLSAASRIRSPRLIAAAISRGYGSAIFWSPYFAAMALMVAQLSITWASVVLYLLILVVISFMVSFFVDLSLIKQVLQEVDQKNVKKEIDSQQLRSAVKKVVELFFLLILLMTVVWFIDAVTEFGMVLIICLVSIIFPLIWSLLSGKTSEYGNDLQGHIFFTLPNMKKEIILFLVAGFFSGALVHAHFGDYLTVGLQEIFGSFKMGMAFCLSLFMVMSAMIGVHPMVIVTILVTTIEPEGIGVSREFFAVLLLGSFGMANVISPASAVNNLLANLLKIDIMDVSFRWNLKYVLIMLMILPMFLILIQL